MKLLNHYKLHCNAAKLPLTLEQIIQRNKIRTLLKQPPMTEFFGIFYGYTMNIQYAVLIEEELS
jgi:hypothetical protein